MSDLLAYGDDWYGFPGKKLFRGDDFVANFVAECDADGIDPDEGYNLCRARLDSCEKAVTDPARILDFLRSAYGNGEFHEDDAMVKGQAMGFNPMAIYTFLNAS